jgi:hypothetical protein
MPQPPHPPGRNPARVAGLEEGLEAWAAGHAGNRATLARPSSALRRFPFARCHRSQRFRDSVDRLELIQPTAKVVSS